MLFNRPTLGYHPEINSFTEIVHDSTTTGNLNTGDLYSVESTRRAPAPMMKL